jgi:hypothetical protein
LSIAATSSARQRPQPSQDPRVVDADFVAMTTSALPRNCCPDAGDLKNDRAFAVGNQVPGRDGMKLLLSLSVATLLGLPLLACGQATALDRQTRLPGRIVVETRIGSRSIRSTELSVYLETMRRRRGAVTPRPTSPARRTNTASRTVVDVPAPTSADRSCLQTLRTQGVAYVHRAPVRGLAAPLEIVGPVGGVRLLARAGRAPIMDCELARALGEAAPIFRQMGITGLSFSGAYDYRKRRGSNRLS